jgi:hypothetical protein
MAGAILAHLLVLPTPAAPAVVLLVLNAAVAWVLFDDGSEGQGPTRRSGVALRQIDARVQRRRGAAFTPVVFLKAGCPFCLKVRLALLETGQLDQVVLREFLRQKGHPALRKTTGVNAVSVMTSGPLR